MARDGTLVSPILLLSIAAAWVAAVPLQAGTNSLLRDLYGPVPQDFFGPYPEDHGSTKEETLEQLPSTGSSATAATTGTRTNLSRASTRYLRESSDRLGRNLDQIGGGNLLRRGQPEYDSARWPTARRNLDHIGGGNLLRDTNARIDRNLDQIGGANLLRNLDGAIDGVEDNLRRNLDQIGGGNLVRGLTEAMVRELARQRGIEFRPRQ